MKKPLLTIATIAAAITLLNADTITWTGGGDGKSWNDTANWKASSTDAAPTSVPLSIENSGDQVVISGSGVEVEYNGGDPRINSGESLTISDGAMLTQTVASWWWGEDGTVTIDGGTFDTGSCSGTHTWANFNVVNGGTLIARTDIPDAKVTLDDSSTYERVSANSYTYTGTEKFTKFTGTGQNVEVAATASALDISNVVWTCKLFSAPALAVKWVSGSLVTWDTAFGGYYNAGGTIDIAEGWTGSFTFAYSSANVFANCFQNKITYNGTALTAETFAELFDVESTTVTDPENNVHAASRVSLARTVDWKLGTIAASDITSSNAVLSAAVTSFGAGDYSVYMAYSTDAVTEGNVISLGQAVTVTDGVTSNTVDSLTEFSVYNYAFAIVTNGAVAAFKSDSFVASDYDYIYNNGWIGGAEPANLPASIDSVLFLSDFTTAGEIRLDNKRIINAVLTAGTMLYGTLAVENSAIVNTRNNTMNQAPYGFYGDLAVPLDFISTSGDGIVKRACSYTFRATDDQLANFKTAVIDGGKIKAGGETISSASYEANFSLETASTKEAGTYDYGEGAVAEDMNVTTLTMWEQLPANAAGNWTFKDGARVKLNRNTKIAALDVETADVKIDLNGYNLKVSTLTVNGEKKKGEFNKDNLSMTLTGEGSLIVGGPGFSVFVR